MAVSFPLNLMKDEINEILHSLRKGRPTDQVTDEELALEQWKQEIEAQEAVLPDHELAMRIARAPQEDALLISRIFEEEEASRTDRQLAFRLSDSDMPLDQQPYMELYDRQMVDRVITQDTKSPAEQHSGPDAPGTHIHESSKAGFTCVACQEHHIYFNIVQMPCSHCYCRICLIQLFETSLKDQSLFPPQCCRKVIPLSLVRTLIGVSTSQKVVAKAIEINDVYRTYCFKQTCSAYIFPYQRDGNCGTCPDCKEQTCIICKERFHQGKCVEKVPDEILLLASTEGWKRCSRCQYMVELSTGCNHITCRCRYEFCYVCGEVWRTCSCPQFDENRLLERAHNIAARDEPRPDAARVNQVAQRLQQRHECDHAYWRRRNRGSRCENCRDFFPFYLFECENCALRVCRECRFNRNL